MSQRLIEISNEQSEILQVLGDRVGESQEQVIQRLLNSLKQANVRLTFREYVISMLNHVELNYYKYPNHDDLKGKVFGLQVLMSIWQGNDFKSYDSCYAPDKRFKSLYKSLKEQYIRKIFNIDRLY